MPEYGCHVKENQEISCTKGGAVYGEWLALHQVLAGKLCYTFIYIHAWNHYQCCSSSGMTAVYTRILFLELDLAVTEIDTKKSIETRKLKKNHKKCKKM